MDVWMSEHFLGAFSFLLAVLSPCRALNISPSRSSCVDPPPVAASRSFDLGAAALRRQAATILLQSRKRRAGGQKFPDYSKDRRRRSLSEKLGAATGSVCSCNSVAASNANEVDTSRSPRHVCRCTEQRGGRKLGWEEARKAAISPQVRQRDACRGMSGIAPEKDHNLFSDKFLRENSGGYA
jgi:hypothetical protein